jgi:Rrf2 family protein
VTAVRVSAKTDYALRALLVLAEQAPALVKVEALTAAEGMPRKFVELILSELRRAGLVVSRRGSDGGYGLALPPERITVGAVVRLHRRSPFRIPLSTRIKAMTCGDVSRLKTRPGTCEYRSGACFPERSGDTSSGRTCCSWWVWRSCC